MAQWASLRDSQYRWDTPSASFKGAEHLIRLFQLIKVRCWSKVHYWKQIESCSLHQYHSLYDVKEILQLDLWAVGNCKGLSRDGGRVVKLAENLRAFPFNKDLSNETIFITIHEDGQYQREMKWSIGHFFLVLQSLIDDWVLLTHQESVVYTEKTGFEINI